MLYFQKKNSKENILYRRNNYIKTKKIFNCNILKINKDEFLLLNKYKLDIKIYIIKNN